MSDLTSAQISAAAAARRAAEQRAAQERAQKRAAIQAQIQQWESKLSKVNSQLSGLTAEQSNLNTYLGDWNTQKTIYSENEILSDVVIVNVFEGVCADRIKEEFSSCITEMNQTCSGVSGLKGNVGMQITRLNQYVSVINTKLASLRSELSSI